MKTKTFGCDFCDLRQVATYETHGTSAIHLDYPLQMIFRTEQTEGRLCEPYISTTNVDICDECLKKLIASGKYIQATGAMGYNNYITPWKLKC